LGGRWPRSRQVLRPHPPRRHHGRGSRASQPTLANRNRSGRLYSGRETSLESFQMEMSADHPPLWKVIAGATLLVGTLDISDAFIFYGLHGVSPVRILQGIASGVLGRAAFGMGHRAALLGLFFHFFIAFSATSVFLLAARKLPLAPHPWLYGALFGMALYI